MSLTWYTWLEQGRDINVSPQILPTLARALQLDEVERAHLFRLAAAPRPSPSPPSGPAKSRTPYGCSWTR